MNSIEACHCIVMYGGTSYFIALIMAEMLNAVLASIKIAKLGYASLIGHYLLRRCVRVGLSTEEKQIIKIKQMLKKMVL